MSEIRAGDTGGPGEQRLIWYLASLCKETFVDDKEKVSLFDTAILSRSPLLSIMWELLQDMPVQLLFKNDERCTRLQGAAAVTANRVGAFMKKQIKQLLLAVFECCYRGLLGNPEVHSFTQAAVHLRNLKLAGQRGPIFVMGFPRSGTSLMQLLLSMDETARSPQRWEYITPSSFLERKKRVARARNIQRGFKQSARDGFWARVEETRPTFPAEDIDLFHFMRANDEFPELPAVRQWIRRMCPEHLLNFQKLMVKLLECQGHSKPPSSHWVFKDPRYFHPSHIRAILHVFPSACFVWLHREPRAGIAAIMKARRLDLAEAEKEVEVRCNGLRDCFAARRMVE